MNCVRANHRLMRAEIRVPVCLLLALQIAVAPGCGRREDPMVAAGRPEVPKVVEDIPGRFDAAEARRRMDRANKQIHDILAARGVLDAKGQPIPPTATTRSEDLPQHPPAAVDGYEELVRLFEERNRDSKLTWEEFQSRVKNALASNQSLQETLQGTGDQRVADPAPVLQQLESNKAGRPMELVQLLDKGLKSIETYESIRNKVRTSLATILKEVTPAVDKLGEILKEVESLKTLSSEEAKAKAEALLSKGGLIAQVTDVMLSLQSSTFANRAMEFRVLIERQTPAYNEMHAALQQVKKEVPSQSLADAIDAYLKETHQEFARIKEKTSELFDDLKVAVIGAAMMINPIAAAVLAGFLLLAGLFCLIFGCESGGGGGGGGGEGTEQGESKSSGAPGEGTPADGGRTDDRPGPTADENSKPVPIEDMNGPHLLSPFDAGGFRIYRLQLDGKPERQHDLSLPLGPGDFAQVTSSIAKAQIEVSPGAGYAVDPANPFPIVLSFKKLAAGRSDPVRVQWTSPSEAALLPPSVLPEPPAGAAVDVAGVISGAHEYVVYMDESRKNLIFSIAFNGRPDDQKQLVLPVDQVRSAPTVGPEKKVSWQIKSVEFSVDSDGRSTFPVSLEFSGVRDDGQNVKIQWQDADKPIL